MIFCRKKKTLSLVQPNLLCFPFMDHGFFVKSKNSLCSSRYKRFFLCVFFFFFFVNVM